jgi:hypothetical protein
MTITKDEALRRIAERYPCDCEVVAETILPGVTGTCRTKWPAEPSQWCAHCLATDALEDA